jgi:hypothetical protein
MNNKTLEKELRIKFQKHKKKLSDPFELLDLVLDIRKLKGTDKSEAIELADEIYFNYGKEETI